MPCLLILMDGNFDLFHWKRFFFCELAQIYKQLFIQLETNFNNLQYNTLIRWFTGSIGQMTHWSSVWCSKQYSFYIIFYRLGHSKLFIFFWIYEKIEKKIEKNFARNYEKRIILGTSDAWLTSHLSQQNCKPAYYTVDCQIYKPRDSRANSHKLKEM